jgi:antitoxin component of RelBE/YafQ-DinJ toxin-antitoxin module
MTSLVSIRINDELLKETKANAHRLHLSQTDYIRQAIERMNSETERRTREKRLKNASFRVRRESMRINAEFSKIEHDPQS